MKKQISKLIGRRMAFQLLILSALAIFAVSCDEESSQLDVEPETPEAAIKKASENKGNSNAPGDASIATIATEEGFTELVGALVYVDEELETGLVDLFSEGTDQYTVFAPTNEAFKALYEALGEDVDGITDLEPELVLDVLLYHVTEGRRASNSVVPPVRPRTIETLLGETFSVSKEGVISDIAGQETAIVLPDISASNGIIHVIDGVLLPLDGSNGENSMEEEVSGKKDDSNAPGNNSIAGIATDQGFTELVGALVYVDEALDAGLVDLFSEGSDQYTVFAPTNEAFEALYKALEVDGITDLKPELVLDVLLYHVTEGRRASNSVVPPVRPRKIETLLGEKFTVNKNGVITDIAGQNIDITVADVSASNGIIHVIDGVLLPLE